MKKHKRITFSNLPSSAPIFGPTVIWLLLDRLQVGPVWWGVYWTLTAILVIFWIIAVLTSEYVDIFDDEKGS